MTKGRRPKPPHLRLIEGTHRDDRHGDRREVARTVAASAQAFGTLEKPKAMRGEAANAWRKYIAPASWLDRAQEPLAIMFCELWAEFRQAPSRFNAARHAQLRGISAELGLTDDRRRRVPAKAEKDEFFGD